MIKVRILSSSYVFKAGITALLNSDPDLAIGIEAEDRDLSLKTNQAGDIWIMQAVELKASQGISDPAVTHALAILVIGDDANILSAISTAGVGVWGVLPTRATGDALKAAVHALHEGLIVGDPDLITEWGNQAGKQKAALDEAGEGIEQLTSREIEILQWITNGLANKQVAQTLGISENTVKFHVSSIYSKLGVNSRTEAIRKGARFGIVAL